MKYLLAAIVLILPLWATDYPWCESAPPEVEQASLQPDTVLDELPCNWRPALTPIVKPLVTHCRTASEAVLNIAAQLSKATGVYYSPERSKHNMNVLEALAEKKVSCTGQSILLVCALRSVGIPARAVGVLSWNHIQGNHTWAEAWFDGEWHMIEFNEPDFNTPWVMEYIGMLNPQIPEQRIKAASPQGHDVWGSITPLQPRIPAVDVTNRYTQLARQWYQKNGLPTDCQRLLVDYMPRQASAREIELIDASGCVVSASRLPALSDDMRYYARLTLPRQGEFSLRIKGSGQRIRVRATETPVQILKLSD